MCCCGKAVINGEQGYSWDGKSFSVRKPWFAELEEGDVLVKELPGRCGGIDSHSYDFRVVRRRGRLVLLVYHGGGAERIELQAYAPGDAIIEAMSDHECYWTLLMVYHVQADAKRMAQGNEEAKWRKAAANRTIKTRKVRNSDSVKVWIERETVGEKQ